MAAEVNGTGAAFSVGVVRSLFEIHPRVRGSANVDPGHGYDVSPDGQRFLVNEGVEEDQAPITLLVNWPALLKKP